MKFLIKVLLFVKLTFAADISCGYVTDKFSFLGTIYFCDVRNLYQTIQETVTSVSTNHNGGKSNSAVKAIQMRDQTCRILPDGFNNFFSNIEGLDIYNSQLTELKVEHLKQFPKLRGLWIRYNQVEVLESGLFEHNSKIEYIHFGWNKLMHIGSNIFGPLKNLDRAFFPSNICISKNAESKDNLPKLITEIKEKCPPDDLMAENEFFNAENFKKLFDSCEKKTPSDNGTSVELNERREYLILITNLQNQIDDLSKTINEQKTEIYRLKGKRNL